MRPTRIRDIIMRKRIIVLFAAAIGLLGLSSCATLSSLNAISDGTSLNAANYDYVRTVKESASSTYILGIFGGSNVERKAYDSLKEKANLQSNQALTNFAITTSNRVILGIVVVKTVVATADVVQFR